MHAKRENVVSPVAVEQKAPTGRRLNLILSEPTYAEAISLSRETRRTISELLRFGLALVRIAVLERRTGSILVVMKPTGEIVKEIVIPL